MGPVPFLSAEQLQQVTDAVPALIAYLDRDLVFRMCNQAYADWLARPRDEIVGRPIAAVLGADVQRHLQPQIDAALAGTPQDFEQVVRDPHGVDRRLHALYTPQRDAAGAVIGFVGLLTDITGRRQTEARLQVTEERYRSLFDSIDEGFCVIEPLYDAQGRPVDYFFHEVNPAFVKQAGMHDAAGRRMLEFVSYIEPHWLTNYSRVALTGEPMRFSAEYRSLGRWFDVYAFRVGDPAARRVAVLFNDITTRKHTEDALRESEARFRNMSDHSPVMLWVTDAAGRCLHLNERWSEFTGRTAASGLGFGWICAIHPDDRPAVEAAFHAGHRQRIAYRQEYRLQRRDGSHRWVIDAAAPRFSPHGDFLGCIGSIIDIQERKEAEDALRQNRERFDIVRDAAQVGFWFCDLPLDVLEWDHRVKEHFWLPADARVTIDLFFQRLHPDDREPTRTAITRALAERASFATEYRTVDPATGAEKWIRAIGRTFCDSTGQPRRFDGITLDVTERRQNEDALRLAKEQAERASRAKDDFIAQLSHELRTPLTPVLMAATALGEDPSLGADLREQLEMIARNVALEARLIDDLLDLTRITHGQLALRAELCDTHALARLVVNLIQDEAREKGIDLVLELAAPHHHCPADSARLQQVFWNLLRNAVKFTPPGGRVLLRSSDRPSSAALAAADRLLRFEVIDDGIGFSRDTGPQLFEPFERGAAAHDPRYPGLGLGLAIARAIVELHHGTIAALSEGPGRGATFRFELPGARTAPRAPDAALRPSASAAPPLRLLVVEDHEPTLKALTTILRRQGHQVVPANSVGSALAAADAQAFDLVISDLGLPDGSGVQLMRQLRARHRLRGIALSGYGMETDQRRSAEAGFVSHLVKPVDVKEVRRALHQAATQR